MAARRAEAEALETFKARCADYETAITDQQAAHDACLEAGATVSDDLLRKRQVASERLTCTRRRFNAALKAVTQARDKALEAQAINTPQAHAHLRHTGSDVGW